MTENTEIMLAPTEMTNPAEEYFGDDCAVVLDEGTFPLSKFLRTTEKVNTKGGTSYGFSVVPKGGKTADSIKSQFPLASSSGLHAIHKAAKKRLGDRIAQLTTAADRADYGASRLQLFANGDFSVKHTAPTAAPKSKAKAAPVESVELVEMQNLVNEQEEAILALTAKIEALTA